MNKLLKKFEDIMVAVTFAEAGEYDEAGRLSESGKPAREDLVKQHEVMKEAALQNAGK